MADGVGHIILRRSQIHSMRRQPVLPGAFLDEDGDAVGKYALVDKGRGRSRVVMDIRSIFQRLQQLP